MDDEFKKKVDQLPSLLEKLNSSPLKPWDDLGSPPEKGIYVFFENRRPIYTGRTNRMKTRIKEHGRPSSSHNSAPFAFNLAKEEAAQNRIDVNRRRSELEKDPAFASLFLKAKQRISRMQVRVIKIDDPIMQTLFEVYASMALDTTRYNDFCTH